MKRFFKKQFIPQIFIVIVVTLTLWNLQSNEWIKINPQTDCDKYYKET